MKVTLLFICFLSLFGLLVWKLTSTKEEKILKKQFNLIHNLTPITDDCLDKFSHFNPENSRRSIEENVILEPTVIPLDTEHQNVNQRSYAYRYIFNQLLRYQSDMIFYPYPFGFETSEGENFQFDHGGFINTKDDNKRYFKSYKTDSEVHFGKAKTLYDFNVAVLKIQKVYQGQMMELLYEADRYCEVFLTFLSHYGKECLFADAYKKLEDKKPAKLVYLGENDLDVLFEEEDKFQLLIIPDIVLNTEDFIIKTLGTNGISQIKSFVERGGKIYVSGKGGILLEKMDLIKPNTYKKDEILIAETNSAKVIGCEENENPDNTNYFSFVKQSLCFSVTEASSEVYMLSSHLMNEHKVQQSGLKEIMYFNSEGLSKKSTSSGFQEELSEVEKGYLPMTLYKQVGKGEIIFSNGMSAHTMEHIHWFFNAVFLVMGRNFYMNNEIDLKNGKKDQPIPGNEPHVILDVKSSFFNLFSDDLSKFKLWFWLPPLVDVHNIRYEGVESSGVNYCNLIESLSPPDTLQPLNISGYECNFNTIESLSSFNLILEVEIMDGSVTRRRNSILMLYSRIEYINTRINKKWEYEVGGFYINAKSAALLKANVNPDPSSFYPIPGKGVYVDNVLQAINVEHTSGYDVQYIAMLPLVTPAVDGNDQSKFIKLVKFWNEYYEKTTNGFDNYKYPMVNKYDYDYIDYHFLSGKDTLLNANWDTGVRHEKAVLNTSLSNMNVNTKLCNYSSTNTNSYVVTKQIHYDDSKNFYEHATQQNLVYIDTTKINGAASKYPNGIPSDMKKVRKLVTKHEFIWVRSDIYFYYSDDQYTQPAGLGVDEVISIDKYKTSFGGDCNANGRAKILVDGYFDSTRPGGLKPNEYSNELLNNCQGPMFNGTMYRRLTDMSKLEEVSEGNITKTHYLIPVTESEVTRPLDLIGFIEQDLDTGYLQEYPDVKYINAYELAFALSPDITRLGGKFEIILPHAFKRDPIKNQLITYTADHIAVYKTIYNEATKTITTYFNRGWMPNERFGKDSGIRINLEELNTNVLDFTLTLKIHELKYDVSRPDLEFKKYFFKETRDILVPKKAFFSLPALKLLMNLDRNGDHSIRPWENLEPMSRYGYYFQELLKHRTVWGIAESHHVTDPGLTSESGGFSVISQVGISSIPFIEYLTVGAGQVIPSATETSRIFWRDLWGRPFNQPVRSVFPDVPPIPPPLRNFMLSTTFELTKQDEGGTRLMEWNSEDRIDISLKLKLLNNYPKHFDITTCKANEVYGYVDHWNNLPSRIFADPPYPKQIKKTPDDDRHIHVGHKSFYGECFAKPGTKLEGTALTNPQFKVIAKHCNKGDKPNKCEKELQNANIPILKRVPSTSTSKGSNWNFSPQIKEYYPNDYIKENMWDLTHYDYDDNVFDISYKYHMDNRLSSLDNSIYKPHNILVQPIFKGFGYQIEYSKTHSVKRHGLYQGWYSDNLQNKDDTLLAGQTCCNDVSVNKQSCLNENNWISIDHLKNTSDVLINKRLSNIYICEFNRKRIKMNPNNLIKYYPNNVYINNIVPVKYRLSSNELTNYNCDTNKGMYYPHNISMFDSNYVKTNNARDWMYFAAALRGGAKETLNFFTELFPFPELNFEGDVKINEGGRFVYWNPANGPNSFLIVDNVPQIIKAIRSDITMDVELFPKSSAPFDVEIYHFIEIKDVAEIGREFRDNYYTNWHGYGDSSTMVYVGGIEGSSALVKNGEETYVKVSFLNNAGFDWNLKSNAILSVDIDSHAISAYELLSGIRHTIQHATKYNFMTVEIPAELQPFITITPSDHCARIAPLFFDFQSINVAEIRDGYKADYFYKIKVHDDIPDTLRGRVWKLPVTLNKQFFDHLPSYNDPTESTTPGFHDYELTIPDIHICIPFSSKHEKYPNKCYHYMGYSKDLFFKHSIDQEYNVIDAKFMNVKDIGTLRNAAAFSETSFVKLNNFWNTLTESVIHTYNKNNGEIAFDLTQHYTQFPILVNPLEQHMAELYILVKTQAKQIPFGTNYAVNDGTLYYTDYALKSRESKMSEPNYRTVNIRGPWLKVDYFASLVREKKEKNEKGEEIIDFEEQENQMMYPKEEGIMKLIVKSTNVGDGISYNLKYKFQFDRNIKIVQSKIKDKFDISCNNDDATVLKRCNLTIHTNHDLAPGVMDAREYYLTYYPFVELLNRTDYYNFPKVRIVLEKLKTEMELTEKKGQKIVTQEVIKRVSFPYVLRAKDTVYLNGNLDRSSNTVQLYATANQPTINNKNILYVYYFTNVTTGTKRIIEVTEENTCTFTYNNKLNEMATYQVDTIDPDTRNHLATAQWKYQPWAIIIAFLVFIIPVIGCIIAACVAVVVILIILIWRWSEKKKERSAGGKRGKSYTGDAPYSKLEDEKVEEEEMDMKDIIKEMGQDGQTGFFFKGRPVSIQWNSKKKLKMNEKKMMLKK